MYKFLLIFLVLTVLGYMYDIYKKKELKKINIEHEDIVRRYLLNSDALTENKPIIWVHIDYETNSRHWLDFGGRNSKALNQPYKLLTLKSIIKQAGDDFNVCIIDDYSFTKLMSNWSIDVSKLASPLKSHMRNLGLMNLLYKYGGMLVPSSYLALKNLSGLYDTGLNEKECFIMETNNNNISSTYINAFPNHMFMGSKRGCSIIKHLIQYIESLNSRDFTDEQTFLGEVDKKCFELVNKNKMQLLDGKLIGCFDKTGKPILVDHLLQNSYITLSDNNQGILIPDKEILNRIKYQWFARLSPQQVLDGNTILSKYFIVSM